MLSVLILEDDPNKLAEVAEVLRNAGVDGSRLRVAPNAMQAREELSQKAFDLLIIDLSVPEMPGDAPDETAGFRLLEDLFEGDGLLMPAQIIGLTGFDELAASQADGFAARGVLLMRYEPASSAWRGALRMRLKQIAARVRAEGRNRAFGASVGIVCAVEVEFDAVEQLPWHWEDESVPGDPGFYLRGWFETARGRQDTIAVLCGRPGMSAASIATTKLINAWNPRLMAMTGITAAVHGRANYGDAIVAEQCWDWGMGKWVKKKGQLLFQPGPHSLSIDPELLSSLRRIARDDAFLASLQDGFKGEKPDHALSVVIGPVASGSAVIAAQEMSAQIQLQHRKLVGIEMEAYGVYAATSEAVAPRPQVCAVKAVSDFADSKKIDKWQPYAAYTSANIVRALAERYLA